MPHGGFLLPENEIKKEVRLTLRLLALRPAGLSLRSISKMPTGILSNYVLISNIHHLLKKGFKPFFSKWRKR